MESYAAYLISIGCDSNNVIEALDTLKKERQQVNSRKFKARKAEQNIEKVKQLLKCEYGRPKVKHWAQSHVKAKAMKPCEVCDCPTIAVRFVHVAYENKDAGCHMCLSHFNIAHRVLTDLP